MGRFRHVGLVARPGRDSVVETLRALLELLRSLMVHVVLEEDTAALLDLPAAQSARLYRLGELVDLVIVVGGDGSLLRVARAMARYHKPVLGINRGRLGFLTDIAAQGMEEGVRSVLAGHFSQEARFLFECHIRAEDEEINQGLALNDVVLYSGRTLHMVEFELFIDGNFVYRLHADGLIIASPTGSTAYALSGGGPILHPRMDAMVLVPMHPHTLNSRPIVVDGNSEIKLKVLSREFQPMVSCDGQEGRSLAAGDWIYVRKYPHKLQLLHPPQHDFYKTLRTKMGWNHRNPSEPPWTKS